MPASQGSSKKNGSAREDRALLRRRHRAAAGDAIRVCAPPRPAVAVVMLSATVLPAALLLVEVRAWRFRVFLDATAIGFYRFSRRQDGGEHALSSAARLDVKLLCINAHRERHEATKRWRGDARQAWPRAPTITARYVASRCLATAGT